MLINVKAIEGSVDRYLLKNGFPSESVNGQDLLDIELSGGEWNEYDNYVKNDNLYSMSCTGVACTIMSYDNDDPYSSATLEIGFNSETNKKHRTCFTDNTDKGRFICKYLEPLGWEYYDDEW
ncbi:MAG: hypothetical protein J6S61_05770 [Elusimicrobiaceae bacterium]|nr:hypothetical protein [Elusimicrobiaceae bacterium]